MAPPWDLLVRGGTVIDPAQSVQARRDVAFRNGTVAAVAETLTGEATEVIDATGALVTPGLIDIHVHVYHGLRTDRHADQTAAKVVDDSPGRRRVEIGAEGGGQQALANGPPGDVDVTVDGRMAHVQHHPALLRLPHLAADFPVGAQHLLGVAVEDVGGNVPRAQVIQNPALPASTAVVTPLTRGLMSKFLALGMELPQVVAAVTSRAAAAIGKSNELGSLATGMAGDAVVMDLEDGHFIYVDGAGHEVKATQRFRTRHVIREGRRPAPHADPV